MPRASVIALLLAPATVTVRSAQRRRARAEMDDANDLDMAAWTENDDEALRRSLTTLGLEEIGDLTRAHAKCAAGQAKFASRRETTVTRRVFDARRTMAELVQTAGIERGWP